MQGGEEDKPRVGAPNAAAAAAAATGSADSAVAPGLASLMQSSKPDQKTTLDPDGKRLQASACFRTRAVWFNLDNLIGTISKF